ncbi:hypothetical protein FBEOM_5210 [Fusarium beomiforme]|uniref:Uncharacterized protein n=1 Tax=Fusarium beomiforme TaxID=44412 RepID=A0A9P5ALN4_9HYPO|nr:hypothetical protein FBEOM_5210 [Fusarium beomiforme]
MSLQISNILGMKRPDIRISANFDNLPHDDFTRTKIEVIDIHPWSAFNFRNISHAYGDLLGEKSTIINAIPEEIRCLSHADIASVFYRSLFNIIGPSIEKGSATLRERLKTTTALRWGNDSTLRSSTEENRHSLEFGSMCPVIVFYDDNIVQDEAPWHRDDNFEGSFRPFLATGIVIPSRMWKSKSLAVADPDESPELGPVEQLATCARKTNTSLAFILGDKDVVLLQFFRAEGGGTGVY